MTGTILMEHTQRLLEETLLDGQSTDDKVRSLLRAEYMRRLAQYRRIDLLLTRKYGVPFEEFVARHIVRQQGYTWEVESDAMDWETARGGMKTIERKLKELQADEHP